MCRWSMSVRRASPSLNSLLPRTIVRPRRMIADAAAGLPSRVCRLEMLCFRELRDASHSASMEQLIVSMLWFADGCLAGGERDCEHQPDPARLGQLLSGRPRQPLFWNG